MTQQPPRGPEQPVRVRVFGDLCVVHGDLVIPVIPRMLRALLGVLVVNVNRVVSADRLVDQLWQDEPPTAPTAGLQAYISNLRKLLEPDRPARLAPTVLLTKDPGYSLRLDLARIDLTEFEILGGRGRELLTSGDFVGADAALGEALGLWKGQPFAELADEPWSQSTVVRVADLRATVVEDRMAAWLGQGRHDAAVSELRAAVEAEPWRERGWELLLIALYRSQRQAEALRAFQECRRRFNDELGLDPGPQLRRLEQQILAHDDVLDAPPPTAPSQYLVVGSPQATIPPLDPFIGRHAQLSRLRERLGNLGNLGGGGGLVALVGEAGIGKSTLAERVAVEARLAGVHVVETRCLDAAPPLWPWIQLVQGLQPANNPARMHAEQTLRGEHQTLSDERSAVFAAYEAVAAALREAVAATPLLLVIDDLHGADPATLKLLSLLVDDLVSMDVLIIVSARDDEGDPGFDAVMTDLMSRRGAERLALRGLEVDDVATFARRFPDAEQSQELASALHARTAGNPYFLTQLARLLSSTRPAGRFGPSDVRAVALPEDLRGVLNRRISRLSAETQSLLAVAAVIGREADLVLVEHASDRHGDELMIALEPAVAAGLLAEVDERWACRFVHPLVHEVVLADMSRLRKARLHARAAKALRLIDGQGDRVIELAYHLLEAGPFGDPDDAVDVARIAARLSARQGIWSESVRLLRSALALADTVTTSPGTRCDLLIELGEALRCCGDATGSHAMLERAIAGASELGDERRLTLAAVAFGQIRTWGARGYGVTDPAVIAILERQLEVADLDQTLRVRLLCTLGIELHYTELAEVGRSLIEQGVSLARTIGDGSLLGTALVAQCFATRSPDHLVEHRHAAYDALALAGRGISVTDELTARIHLLTEHLRLGEFGAFEADLARCRDIASRLRSPELDGHLAFSEAGLALLEGRWNDVERLIQMAEIALSATSSPGADWAHLAGLVAGRRARGALGEIAPDLAAARGRSGFDAFRPFDALAVVATENAEQAIALVHRSYTPPPRDWSWFFTMGGWAEVAALLGTPDPAGIYDTLLPFAGDIAIAGSGLDAGGPVDGLLAGLAERLGRADDARRHALAALRREQQLGIRAWEPRSRALLERLGP